MRKCCEGTPGAGRAGEAGRGRAARVLRRGMVVALGLAALAAPGARGDVCGECGPPTAAELAASEGFALDVRDGHRDYVQMDGGECDLRVDGTPRVHRVSSWLVLRGSGEVWTCPHGTSADAMTATVTESDSQAWTLSGSLEIGGTVLGLGLSAKVTETVSKQVTLATTTSISKTLRAAWCHRIRWYAYFEVANYVATVDVTLVRRFAWWTKNWTTGHEVHREGNVWTACGSTNALLEAKAPIAGYFHLQQQPCADEACREKVKPLDLGFFPPLPPYLPPVTPGDEGEGEGSDPDGEQGPEPEDGAGSDPVPPSGDLDDPPAGIAPPPPGFEESAP